MLIDELEKVQSEFETLAYGKVSDDKIIISNPICMDYIPLGNVNPKYYIDKRFQEVNILDYITNLNYYCYFKPVTYDLFYHYFNLNKEVQKILENYKINIYEVEIIMAGALKDNGGIRNLKTTDCYKLERINYHKVTINTPPNLLNNDVIITASYYYPNCLFILG